MRRRLRLLLLLLLLRREGCGWSSKTITAADKAGGLPDRQGTLPISMLFCFATASAATVSWRFAGAFKT